MGVLERRGGKDRKRKLAEERNEEKQEGEGSNWLNTMTFKLLFFPKSCFPVFLSLLQKASSLICSISSLKRASVVRHRSLAVAALHPEPQFVSFLLLSKG